MKKGIITAIYEQWAKVPAVETADLSGQTVVIIGANTVCFSYHITVL